ncbi:hypothetical protein NDU88_000372 [Pleurodeles waltl]|uniref:Uncharacterized protein n=1 Tax=Pleurodeles waltl TaxID=8319 RepID=A0AAV7V8T8_PLEWA|nr:hypothetical protein NDU88_000372 [Pleurodeles waltl]
MTEGHATLATRNNRTTAVVCSACPHPGVLSPVNDGATRQVGPPSDWGAGGAEPQAASGCGRTCGPTPPPVTRTGGAGGSLEGVGTRPPQTRPGRGDRGASLVLRVAVWRRRPLPCPVAI